MKMGMKRTLFEISLFRKYQMSESLLDQFGNNNNITTIKYLVTKSFKKEML